MARIFISHSGKNNLAAIVLLASPEALGSEEVRREIVLAEEYHKPILVGLLAA